MLCKTKVIFLSFFLIAFPVQAKTYVLLGQESTVAYSIYKIKGSPLETEVVGELTADAKNTLDGTFEMPEKDDFSHLSGRIKLAMPKFDSQNKGRDQAVLKTLQKGKEKTITAMVGPNDLSHIPNSNSVNGKVNFVINDVPGIVDISSTYEMVTRGKEDLLMIDGTFDINRKDFNITFTGLTSIGDLFIDNEVSVTYKLLFKQKRQ